MDMVQQGASACSQPFEWPWPKHQEAEDEKKSDGKCAKFIGVNSSYLRYRAENDRCDRKGRNKAKRDKNRPRFARLTNGSSKKDRKNRQRTWCGDRDNTGKESE